MLRPTGSFLRLKQAAPFVQGVVFTIPAVPIFPLECNYPAWEKIKVTGLMELTFLF